MPDYSKQEEQINIASHAFGFLLSLIATGFLISKAIANGNSWQIISFAIFGLSMMILYAASTLYHRETNEALRSKLKIFDHASIYVLIAGTYTPFTLLTLHGSRGWWIFGISWTFAIIGIVLKLFFTGRFKILSTTMYVLMGWMIVFAIKPLVAGLPSEGLYYLIAGGIAYTIGAVLYAIKKIPFNHAIFHFFVLAGTICHFISIYFYVTPKLT
jgi:hemolysin III